jgi:hypothetical protein
VKSNKKEEEQLHVDKSQGETTKKAITIRKRLSTITKLKMLASM